MIQVAQKDITKINYIDAIVVAANKNLQIGTGLYKNIHRCAGERLLKECCLLGGCKEGEAKITGGYNLPCKYIIHTVAPVWIDGNYGEKELLERCYINSLKLALKYDIHSIAFSAIPTGRSTYPPSIAAEIAIKTVMDFIYKYSEKIDLIEWAISGERICRAYRKALKNANYLYDGYI
ncbi:RNase III inhibitor [Coprococcus eutactus]|nr:RNase III inhibitor [Coprococcus eutactus]